jgi:hypothetical protein
MKQISTINIWNDVLKITLKDGEIIEYSIGKRIQKALHDDLTQILYNS